MATVIRTQQSKAETRVHTISFANDLLSAVTVESAVLTHTGPSSETPTVAITTPLAAITLTTPEIGIHYIKCLATLSNSEDIEALLIVRVDY